MKKYVGLWIDHENAMIAAVGEGAKAVARIDSDSEGHIRLSGGSRSKTPYGPQDIRSEQKIHGSMRYQSRTIFNFFT